MIAYVLGFAYAAVAGWIAWDISTRTPHGSLWFHAGVALLASTWPVSVPFCMWIERGR